MKRKSDLQWSQCVRRTTAVKDLKCSLFTFFGIHEKARVCRHKCFVCFCCHSNFTVFVLFCFSNEGLDPDPTADSCNS